MAKRQTTLFQTWGYEGNMRTQNTEEEKFDEDDEEFARAINESLLVEQNQKEQDDIETPGPSWRNGNNSHSAGNNFSASNNIGAKSNSHVSATPLESLPGFDLSAGATWIYPTNKSYRSYQFEIVKSCLFNNTLVCLPTGLGKTFIAAVVMYNFYRWYPQGKIVFMAPTKPLVAQQIEACFNVMGIPQSDTMEMTGSVSIPIRERGWKSKRVFFLTPQVMSNDMSRGLFPAREVKLLIVDEAHKAQGDYAYCQVARELYRSQSTVRIVALSATPGNDIQAVKGVLQNLYISHIELRHEESPDIVPYTNERRVDKIVVQIGAELLSMKNSLLSVIEIFTKRLSNQKAVREGHNPSSYSKFTILKARDEWRQNPPGDMPPNIKGVVEGDFAVLMSLYHGYDLLLQHGMRPFYNFFNKKEEGDYLAKRVNMSVSKIPAWRDMIAILTSKFSGDASNTRLNQSRIHLTQATHSKSQPRIETSHPKIAKLIEVVLDHFKKFGEKNQDTRVMIFSQYRDSVNEVVACLSEYSPTIKPMSFVGQAGTLGKKGLTQKEQIEVISRFRSGGYNTLVATCVGEEGLDIGEVDLIVLFDVSRSPIRLVQRMGRTGRKREGRIVVLVTEGIEERKYNQSLISKRTINKAILEMDKLVHVLYKNCPRMVPAGLEPECHQMKMVTEMFKAKVTNPGRSDRQLEGPGRAGGKGKRERYDVFRENCGFLTEEELGRWSAEVAFTDPVPRIQDRSELWRGDYSVFSPQRTEGSPPGPRFNLAAYSLWQGGEQNRKLVGPSDISNSFSRIMGIISNPISLDETVNLLETNLENRTRTSSSQRTKSHANNIFRYFKPSQSTNKEKRETRPVDDPFSIQEEREIVEIPSDHEMDVGDNNGNLHTVLDISVDLRELNEVDEHKALLDELLDSEEEDDDSGFCSLPDSPVFKMSLSDLLSKKELWKQDLRVDLQDVLEESKFKYKNQFLFSSKRYREYIQRKDLMVMPAEIRGEQKKYCRDPFQQEKSADWDILEDQECKNGPKGSVGKDRSDDWSLFELGSPDQEDLEKERRDQDIFESSLLSPGRPKRTGSVFPAQDFNLGSPVLEMSPQDSSQPKLSPEKSKLSWIKREDSNPDEFEKGDFNNLEFPSSPMLGENIVLGIIPNPVETSTPVLKPGRQGRIAAGLSYSDLRSRKNEEIIRKSSVFTHLSPTKESEDLNDMSPVLRRSEPGSARSRALKSSRDIFSDCQTNTQRPAGDKATSATREGNSEDLFGGSDDDLFEDMSMPGDQGNPSVLGATQLVSLLNMDSSKSNHTLGDKPLQDLPIGETREDGPRGLEVNEKFGYQKDEQLIRAAVLRKDEQLTRVDNLKRNEQLTETQDLSKEKHLTEEACHSQDEQLTGAACLNEDKSLKGELDLRRGEQPPVKPDLGMVDANFDFALDLSEDMFKDDAPFSEEEVGRTDNRKEEVGRTDNRKEEVRRTDNRNKEESVKRFSVCPICEEQVEGEEGGTEINSHIDTCLSMQLLEEFSQHPINQSQVLLNQSNILQLNDNTINQSQHLKNRTNQSLRSKNQSKQSQRHLNSTNQSQLNKNPTNHRDQRQQFNFLNKSKSQLSQGTKRKVFDDDFAETSLCSPQSKRPVPKKVKRLQILSQSPPSASVAKRKMCPLTDSSSELDNPSSPVNSRTKSLSDDDSPVFRGRKNPGAIMATQASPAESKNMTDSWSDQSNIVVNKKMKRRLGAEFLDVEAEVSGSDEQSGDDQVEEDEYEASFVDDASQKQDRAMYLRSIKSPVFKQPFLSRKIRPITDDIFSQVPEDSDDSYLEDSFCVGSQVDYTSEPDTLELLEERASSKQFNNKKKGENRRTGGAQLEDGQTSKRRRIIAPEDDSILEERTVQDKDGPGLKTESVCLLLDSSLPSSLYTGAITARQSPSKAGPGPSTSRQGPSKVGPGSSTAIQGPSKAGPGASTASQGPSKAGQEDYGQLKNVAGRSPTIGLDDSSLFCVKPDLSDSIESAEKKTVLFASSEVSKMQEIISSLKHNHQINVVVRQSDLPIVVSVRMVVLRVPEVEFSIGSNRKKLEEKLAVVREGYDKCAIIVESEKVKPGERSRTRNRTKIYDLMVAQLVATKILVLYSEGKESTASILSNLVQKENSKGFGLPRGVRLTMSQEEMLKWTLRIPSIGLGSAVHLVSEFPTLRSLVLAPRQTLEQRGRLSAVRAQKLVDLFTNTYCKDTADLLHL